MLRTIFTVAALAGLMLLAAGVRAGDDRLAATHIQRLSPDAFKKLPQKVRMILKRRGCTIPQESFYPSKDNLGVISGSFARAGQRDYAALCSRHGKSHIYIIWGGPAMCPSVLNEHADEDFLQTSEGRGYEYSRFLHSVRPVDIDGRARVDNKPPFQHATHDGLEDQFVGKASTVHYCHQGKWVELYGAD